MKGSTAAKVGIVILNYNCANYILQCVRSALNQNYKNLAVIVVDNASTDGSVGLLKNVRGIKLIERRENDGVRGRNFGLLCALGVGCEFVFWTDSDTVLDPKLISTLVAYLEQNSDVGIVGPMHYYLDRPSVPYFLAGTLSSRLEPRGRVDIGNWAVDACYVACSLIRKEVLSRILFDERFFIYYEDTDFSTRVHKLGYKVSALPDAKIWHDLHSTTTKVPGLRGYLGIRNQALYAHKHLSPASRPRILLALVVNLFRKSGYWIAVGRRHDALLIFVSFVAGVSFLLFGYECATLRRVAEVLLGNSVQLRYDSR